MSLSGSSKINDLPMQLGYGGSIQLMSLIQQLKKKSQNVQQQIDQLNAQVAAINITLGSLQQQITNLPGEIWRLNDQNGSGTVYVDSDVVEIFAQGGMLSVATGGYFLEGPTNFFQMTTGVGTIMTETNGIRLETPDGTIEMGAGVRIGGSQVYIQDSNGTPYLTFDGFTGAADNNLKMVQFANNLAASMEDGELLTWGRFKDFIDTTFPVGTLIQSVNTLPPASFGGYMTWVQQGLPVMGVYTYGRSA